MEIRGGSKGKSFNDRELAGKVRGLALNHLERILSATYTDPEDIRFQKDILLKLAPTLLPRLQEHTGKDGDPLFDAKSNEKAQQAVSQFLDTEDTDEGGEERS